MNSVRGSEDAGRAGPVALATAPARRRRAPSPRRAGRRTRNCPQAAALVVAELVGNAAAGAGREVGAWPRAGGRPRGALGQQVRGSRAEDRVGGARRTCVRGTYG